jgi:hypothetical protein
VPAGLHVWRNQAFLPTRAGFAADDAPDTDGGIASAANLDLTAGTEVLRDASGALGWTGPLDADSTVLFSASHSAHWKLTVDGEAVEHAKAFEWANRYTTTIAGEGHLSYETSPLRYLMVAAQGLVWLWAFRQLIKRPVGSPELRVVGEDDT